MSTSRYPQIAVEPKSVGKSGGHLDDFRTSIDHLDSAIIAILAERFRLTEKIGRAKAALGLPATDADRERELATHYRALAEAHSLNPSIVADIMSKIIELAKDRHEVIVRGE